VLVLRNLVDDCIATQRALEAQAEDRDLLFGVGGTPAPHHSRFAPDDLDTAKTRLGQEDYRVELPSPAEGPFGAMIEELSVSEWQLEGPPETEEATDVSEGDGEFSFRFSGHSFQYDRLGLSPQSE
jgi:hypothetical protein